MKRHYFYEDEQRWYQLKAKLALSGRTVSGWLREKITEFLAE